MSGESAFQLSSPSRRLAGAVLVGAALVLVVVGCGLDWGLLATAVLPGLALSVPGLALLCGRSRLVAADGALLLGSDPVPLVGELEAVPTAGWSTVLLHRRDLSPLVLASWLPPARAEALMRWLDEQTGRPLARRQAPAPLHDR